MRTRLPARNFRQVPLAVAITAAFLPMQAMATYTVTGAGDSGPGTLRQAMTDANLNCFSVPSPLIDFAIPGTGPFIIALSSPLPQLYCSSAAYYPTIDGYTQAGAATNTASNGFNGSIQIVLDGLGSVGSCGLYMFPSYPYGGSLTVRGLQIQNFAFGGYSSAICAYGDAYVYGNRIWGNNIGISKGGNNGSGNIGDGTPAGRNFIYSNSNTGIDIGYGGPVSVDDNYIGTDPSGTTPAPNGTGITVQYNQRVTISRNVISGNSGNGVQFYDQGDLFMVQNKIGLGVTGGNIGNGGNGVFVSAYGTAASALIYGNTIWYNANGVSIINGNAYQISENSIQFNSGKNINLDMYGGPVPNDVGDADTGPNNRQNYPVLTGVTQASGQTTINFGLDSLPGTYLIEIFANTSPGFPGGERYVANTSLPIAASGAPTPGSFTIGGLFNNISLTATSTTTRDTSEYSPIMSFVGTPAITASTNTLAFGNVPIGSTSTSMSSTITSTGTVAVNIYYIGSPTCYGGPICYGGAEFTCATTCTTTTSYAPGASCLLSATFAPTFTGAQSTAVQFCPSGSPVTITLTGNGVVPPPITVSPSSNDFGTVPIGSSAGPVTFTVSNPGTTPVSIGAPLTSGPFGIPSTTCAPVMAAMSSCNVNVNFTPTASGPASGNLVVLPSGGTPVIVSLTGSGISAPELLLPSSLDFSHTAGTPPSIQQVQLLNSGLAPLTITSITLTGAQFTLAQNCPTTLAPGVGCMLTVGFTATETGEFTGQIAVVTNAPNGSRMIALRGHNSPRPVPTLEVLPREIGYGNRGFGTTSAGQKVTIRNIGGATAVFDSIVVSPDFVILSNNCGASLASLVTCEAQVAMRPMGFGLRQGIFTVSSNADNSPSHVQLTGTSCRLSGLMLGRLGRTTNCGP